MSADETRQSDEQVTPTICLLCEYGLCATGCWASTCECPSEHHTPASPLAAFGPEVAPMSDLLMPLKAGDRVQVPPSSWRPGTAGTVVDPSDFLATGPVYVKRDDTGITIGYRRQVLRRIRPDMPHTTATDDGATT